MVRNSIIYEFDIISLITDIVNIVISRICENFNHRMYEVSPSILEARLLDSGNQILDAAVVGIPNQDNGQVIKPRYRIKITMT